MANILIIDDERSIRNTLRDILEYEKFKIDDIGKIRRKKIVTI